MKILSDLGNDIGFLVDISELVRTLNEEFSACAYHKSLDVLIDNSGRMPVARRIFLEFPTKDLI